MSNQSLENVDEPQEEIADGGESASSAQLMTVIMPTPSAALPPRSRGRPPTFGTPLWYKKEAEAKLRGEPYPLPPGWDKTHRNSRPKIKTQQVPTPQSSSDDGDAQHLAGNQDVQKVWGAVNTPAVTVQRPAVAAQRPVPAVHGPVGVGHRPAVNLDPVAHLRRPPPPPGIIPDDIDPRLIHDKWSDNFLLDQAALPDLSYLQPQSPELDDEFIAALFEPTQRTLEQIHMFCPAAFCTQSDSCPVARDLEVDELGFKASGTNSENIEPMAIEDMDPLLLNPYRLPEDDSIFRTAFNETQDELFGEYLKDMSVDEYMAVVRAMTYQIS